MIETEGLTHLHLRVRDRERFRDAHLVFLNTPGSGDTITLTLRTVRWAAEVSITSASVSSRA